MSAARGLTSIAKLASCTGPGRVVHCVLACCCRSQARWGPVSIERQSSASVTDRGTKTVAKSVALNGIILAWAFAVRPAFEGTAKVPEFHTRQFQIRCGIDLDAKRIPAAYLDWRFASPTHGPASSRLHPENTFLVRHLMPTNVRPPEAATKKSPGVGWGEKWTPRA
jgi:hypothetical protein